MPGVLFTDLILLFYKFQFLDQVTGAAEFVDAPEDIANIHADRAVEILIEGDLVAQGLVVAVECQADEFTVAIQHG